MEGFAMALSIIGAAEIAHLVMRLFDKLDGVR